jgi:hypothetical protein
VYRSSSYAYTRCWQSAFDRLVSCRYRWVPDQFSAGGRSPSTGHVVETPSPSVFLNRDSGT